MNQEVYLVLGHVEDIYQNEFLGIFTTTEKAENFCNKEIEAFGDKNPYSKITIHPIGLDEAFDYSFAEKTVSKFLKNPETGLLEFSA